MTPDHNSRIEDERKLVVNNFDLTIFNFVKSVDEVKFLFELLNMTSFCLPESYIYNAFIKRNENINIFAAYDDNKIIGLLRTVGDKYSSYIDLLIIHPAYQRKGIGSKLIKTYENYYSDKPVYLSVLNDGETDGFYIKNGFKKRKNYLQKQIRLIKDKE